jgi:hypothetical protein
VSCQETVTFLSIIWRIGFLARADKRLEPLRAPRFAKFVVLTDGAPAVLIVSLALSEVKGYAERRLKVSGFIYR